MATQRAPIVPNYNSIWVKHRNNLKHESLSEDLCGLLVTHKVLQKSLHDKAAIGLTRVNPSAQDDAFSFGDSILRAHEICDNQHL